LTVVELKYFQFVLLFVELIVVIHLDLGEEELKVVEVFVEVVKLNGQQLPQ